MSIRISLLIKSLLFLLALIAAWSFSPLAALSTSENSYDLVNAVNDLRAAYGLAPYQIDATLMAYAQEHTDYQASIQKSTHIHSDGSLPPAGLVENVAAGTDGVVTVAIVVYQIWVDWGHRHTMIGYATGDIGAGVALSADGNVYYTIDVRPGEDVSSTTQPGATFVPLLTSTPDAKGVIIHVVRSGETLWSIAISYGVTVDEIRRLNGITEGDTVIYIDQRLLIRPAGAATPVPADGASTVQAPALVMTATAELSSPASAPSQAITVSPSTVPLSAVMTSTPASTTPAAPVATGTLVERNVSMGIVAVLILAIVGLLGGIMFCLGKLHSRR